VGLLSSANAPAARTGHATSYGGNAIYIYGGENSGGEPLADGAYYDTTLGAWYLLSVNNAPEGRRDHTAVWTSSGLVVWGGNVRDATTGDVAPTDTGGVYVRASTQWTPTSLGNAPSARIGHTAISTGQTMIVWGGTAAAATNTGGVYNPLTDSWQPTNTTGAPTARAWHTAVWTGKAMIVWGGASTELEATGAVYSPPPADSWTPMATAGAPAGRRSHVAAWAGGRMVVFGGLGTDASGTPVALGDGGIYDPVANAWTAMATAGAPAARMRHAGTGSGSGGALFIVFGGDDGASQVFGDGGVFNVAQNAWQAIPERELDQRTNHTAVWTPQGMMLWGGTNETGAYVGDGEFFTPP
jgi:N-acetylneuraminic acid mutarotase